MVLSEVNLVNGSVQREWVELRQLSGSLHQSDLMQELQQQRVSRRNGRPRACTRLLAIATARISQMGPILTPIRKGEAGASEEDVVASVGVAGSEGLGKKVTNNQPSRQLHLPYPPVCLAMPMLISLYTCIPSHVYTHYICTLYSVVSLVLLPTTILSFFFPS